METPLISIIVPVYNVEKQLEKCINSILAQTYTNWELLLLDDGSKDNSPEICWEYSNKDPRIRFYTQKNSGVSFTRNRGIGLAKSEYICFIDSDDWVDETYLSNFLPIPEGNCICIQGITYTFPYRENLIMFQYKDVCYEFSEKSVDYIVKSKLLLNGCPVGKLFCRKIILDENLYFDTHLSLNEDHLFVLNYLNNVDIIRTSSKNGYFYYYDYKIPTLTKKEHSSNEYLYASLNLNSRITELIRKIGIKNKEHLTELHTTLGYNQFVKAILKSVTEKDSEKFLRNIFMEWNKLADSKKYFVSNKISYLLITFWLNRSNRIGLNITAFICYYCNLLKNNVFFYLKKYILRY